jgi:hypothetical protein
MHIFAGWGWLWAMLMKAWEIKIFRGGLTGGWWVWLFRNGMRCPADWLCVCDSVDQSAPTSSGNSGLLREWFGYVFQVGW